MIVIYVSAQTAESDIAQFEERIRAISSDALKLDGCDRYEWYRHPDQTGKFTVYGEFDTEANFRSYLQSPVVECIGRDIMPLLTQPPEFKHLQAKVLEEDH